MGRKGSNFRDLIIAISPDEYDNKIMIPAAYSIDTRCVSHVENNNIKGLGRGKVSDSCKELTSGLKLGLYDLLVIQVGVEQEITRYLNI